MAITMTVTESQFIREFDEMGRSNNFSPLARRKLYERMEDFSQDMGEDVDFDVIGICCEWSEMSAEELIEAYGEESEGFDTVYQRVHEASEIIEVDAVGVEPTYLVLCY